LLPMHMPYFLTVIVLVGTVALHLWWRRRYLHLRAEWLREKQSLETAQKQLYQESAQTEAEQQALFNSMSEGVLILDRAGHVQLVNRSLQEFFGLKNEVRGQTIMEAFRLQELAEVTR